MNATESRSLEWTELSFRMSDKDLLGVLDGGSSDSPLQKLSPAGFVALAVFLGFIMTFGFLNNFLVLLLFCKFKKLRTPVNMLLLNISVSDMLVCVCGTTLSFASSVRGRWLLGRSGCMWYGFINSCFGIVSLITLVILSYERYSTMTVHNNRRQSYLKHLLAVGGSWLYSLIWTIPPLLGWSSYGLEGAGTSCSVSWTDHSPKSHSYIICLFVFCLGLPVLVMVYSYGRLLYAVKKLGKIHKTARRRDYHLLIVIITTVVCYLLCWTPYSVVAIMATFGRPGIITPVASIVPSLLAKSSTVINPIIYIFMNKQFYRCFLMLLGYKERSALTEGHSLMATNETRIQLKSIMLTNPASCRARASPLLQEECRCSEVALEQSGTT
ncbi:teleost multiple tissue opsin 2b [Silurus meridionalis]|uniref:teleost multiple tissue opsin 2b n=1 Tax=Silurus meridionalis TaxID=175797 RepID=UPI001EE9E114|nr:teleost multiple tissue opsin 2b [Silurus meridionalis]